MPSTYHWLPVDETNFTVVIVVAVGDKDEMLGSQSVPSGKSHEDWVPPCRHPFAILFFFFNIAIKLL